MKNSYTDNNLHVFIVVSSILHAIIISLILFGLPLGPKQLPEEKVLTFELLPVGKINNVKSKKIQKEKTIQNDDARKIEKSKTPEDSSKSDEPKKEEKKEETENKQPSPEAEKIPEKKIDKKEDKKEEKKPEAKKEDKKDTKPKQDKNDKKIEKNKKAPNDKELDSLLKNLEKESEGHNDKSRNVNKQKSEAESDAFGNYDDSLPESLTNDQLIKQQIMKHWSKPIASVTENIQIKVKLKIEIDGNITDKKIISISCPPGKEMLCDSSRDSIIRAITNASPLVNLEPDDYSSWSDVNVTFSTNPNL